MGCCIHPCQSYGGARWTSRPTSLWAGAVEVGEQPCPECGRQLRRWGGYWRWLRGSATQRLWIRRARCSSCRRSHALLPDFLLERRLDEVEVVGRALVLGIVIVLGMRKVADQVFDVTRCRRVVVRNLA